jgi:LPS-assembly protein
LPCTGDCGKLRRLSTGPERVPTSPIRPLHAAVAVILGLAAAVAQAAPAQADPERWVMCSGRPLFDWLTRLPAPTVPREQAVAEIEADRFDVSGKDTYRLEGGVALQRADQRLAAERLDYVHSTSAFHATGDVRYQDRDLALSAAEASGVLADDRSRLDDVQYQLIGLRGRGSAERIAMQGPLSSLEQVSYTTCDPGDRGWRLDAERIDLDHDEGVGRARKATLRIGPVPVFWLPYASFPIDDRRRTGFLYPVIGSNDGGIDLQVPYYLNLAPHYDATLTPRLIGRRGLMLGAEFRWLGASQGGIIDASWLPDDRLADRDRGAVSIRHDARLDRHWALRSNLNHVSDPRYFEDFGDSLSSISTSLLESSTGLYGRGLGWQASLAAQVWDITDPAVPDSAEPFRRLPRAAVQWSRPYFDWLELGIGAEAVAFDHRERAGARRYDLRPWLALPIERSWGYLRPELAYRHTGYQLDDDYAALGFTDRSPSRGTPIYSVDAALLFERDTQLFGRRLLQTLQPRLYYLRVPFEDQADLPLFDTRELDFSFAQLFRSNRFSGADRQMDANQATLAVTSRWFDAVDGRELGSASLGRIRYFDPQRVQLPGRPVVDRNGSAYAAEVELALDARWRLGLLHQWDPETERSLLSGLRGQWRGRQGQLANLSYRYRRDRLEQVDGSFAWPISAAWRAIGRWNYSLREDSTLEAFGGFEWEGCCLAARLVARHYVRNREGDKNNAIYLEIELKGLASLGRRSGEFLERAILGYSQ